MVSCDEKRDYLGELEETMATGQKTLDPLAKLMHMEILQANARTCEGIMHVTDELRNPYGSVHGGCLVTLADSVAGHNMVGAGKLCVTLNSNINFLSPALGDTVHCYSEIQKLGKKISVVAVEARDEADRLLLTASFTFSTLREVAPHIIEKQA